MTQLLTDDMMKQAMLEGLNFGGEEGASQPSPAPTSPGQPAAPQPDVAKAVVLPQEAMADALKTHHQDVTAEMRFNVGLIREDPRLQVEYFKRQGVNATLEGDEVMIDGRPFRGTEFSFQDFAEYQELSQAD